VNLNRYPLFRQRYDAPVRFLTVARVFYDKGYAEYVAAAEMVHRSYPDVEFEWLGDYDEHSPMTVPHEVLDRDVAAGRIHYLGTTDDVLQYLRRDGVCICLPSYHEGLSKSLMEACAVGLPIIASDIPGCRETVDEGVNGYLVPKCDAQALANAMMRFLQLTQSEKQQMAQASYAKATSTFDVKQTLKGYDTLVRELRA
jgi:glycosyltransferase involved in cell wall biosynthesis